MPDLDAAAFYSTPGPTLARLRSEAPVYFHEPWNAWVLTRYADVSAIIRDSSFSVDRGGAIGRSPHAEVREALEAANRFFGLWMVFSDPPRHTRLRQRVAAAFTPARIREWTSGIDAILSDCLARLATGEHTFDVVSAVAEPLPARMTSFLLGLPQGAESTLHRFTDDFFALFGAASASPEIVLDAHRAIASCRAFFEDVLRQRNEAPGDDLLSAIVAAERDEPTLEQDELLGVAMTLVAGAYGTTTHLIAHAILALLEERTHYEALTADPSLAPGVVEETFRYDGPALSVVRRATRDVVVADATLRAGDRVYCMLHAANHDPEVFEAPERFDPRRSPNRHLGLGAGPHFCLGASLTRLEATRALVALAKAFPCLALAESPIERVGNLSMRGLARLDVLY
ncbi:MAG: cytochrome P450 [Polyangiaceae bacterium]|nr:cytochrome P450 [Polyangiaceae bacterium]